MFHYIILYLDKKLNSFLYTSHEIITMKITLFNINGLKQSIEYINNVLSSDNPERPDILGLNELKCTEKTLVHLKSQLSNDVVNNYHIIWNTATNLSWHGTALFILEKYKYNLLYTTLPYSTIYSPDHTIKGHTKEGE